MPIADMLKLSLRQILSPSPTPSPPTPPPTLMWDQTLTVVAIVAVAVLLAGVGVFLARRWSKQTPGASIVRSWIAISLVLALVLFSAVAFAIPDSNLRSTLIGALTASVGSAIAHYFSSSASDQARRDLLNATVGTELVPNLKGKTEADAATTLGRTSFKLVIDPTSPPTNPAAKINNQDPQPDTMTPKGSSVTVYF